MSSTVASKESVVSSSSVAAAAFLKSPLSESLKASSPNKEHGGGGIQYTGEVRLMPSIPYGGERKSGFEFDEEGRGDDATRHNLALSVSVSNINDSPTGVKGALQDGQSGSTLEKLQEICQKSVPGLLLPSENADLLSQDGVDQSPRFQCHVCQFTARDRDQFNEHVNEHYEFRCPKCPFATKQEKEYRTHLKTFHDVTPEDMEDEQGVRVPKVNSQGKVKTFKCKQCDFVSVTKEEFWLHNRDHIKPEKMLHCPKCPFVTEYKHHLEYHLRNHFGSKPFKCPECSYSCVNKSMLSSHMKSHQTIYQYRCLDCTYATKYCHSLKLHLRKYGHKPAVVLNPDGTPNPLPIIDVYGTRRGPKIKRDDSKLLMSSQVTESFSSAENSPCEKSSSDNQELLKCNKCDFVTMVPDIFENHMNLHENMLEGVDDDFKEDVREKMEEDTETKTKEVDEEEEDGEEEEEEEEENNSLSRQEDYMEYVKRFAPLLYASKAANDNVRDEQEKKSDDLESPGLLSRLYLERLLQHLKKDPGNKSNEEHSSSSSSSIALDLSQSNGEDEKRNFPSGGSNCSSTASSLVNKSNRRKGKAFKIERKRNGINDNHSTTAEDETSSSLDESEKAPQGLMGNFICSHCEIAFTDADLYAFHMSFHGQAGKPFQCSSCGKQSCDRLAFFVHIAKEAHP